MRVSERIDLGSCCDGRDDKDRPGVDWRDESYEGHSVEYGARDG